MTSLKTLGGSIVLTLALAVAALGDGPPSQCMSPGQTETMPCSTAQMAVDGPTRGRSSPAKVDVGWESNAFK
jgi:hypothetical protein